MKIAKFTIERGQVDHLIHNLKALAKAYDKAGQNQRFIAVNLLEAKIPLSLIDKLFKKSHALKVIVQIERKNDEANNS